MPTITTVGSETCRLSAFRNRPWAPTTWRAATAVGAPRPLRSRTIGAERSEASIVRARTERPESPRQGSRRRVPTREAAEREPSRDLVWSD
jgi:hypothetical protein